MVTGRLAPTPSGALHLGNVCAFGAAWLSVRQQGGRLLLRMEDVDATRARPDIADDLRRDLDWLGLGWDVEVRAQSSRDYAPWLERLQPLYFCTCSRAQIGGLPYPGTCRDAGQREGAVRFRLPGGPVQVVDRHLGSVLVPPDAFGDPIVRRRDGVHTYNLAVVADDIEDGVTEVTRGGDLIDHTPVQIHLWRALGASPPAWMHTPVVLGPDGKKLSKSHGALGIAALRDAGFCADDVWRVVLPWLGLPEMRLRDAVRDFDPRRGPRTAVRVSWPESRCPRPGELVSWDNVGGDR